MIVDTEVEVVWKSHNKNRLVSLGYLFTKMGDTLSIKPEHLTKGSSTRIHAKCDMCGGVKVLRYCTHYLIVNRGDGGYICAACHNVKQSAPVETIRSLFEERGYIPLFTTYKNSQEDLSYRCPIHPETVQKIALNHFTRGGGCRHCAFVRIAAATRKRPREDHPNWTGGFGPVANSVRSYLKPWILSVFSLYNNSCTLSGITKGLHVHHLTPFMSIFNEAMSELKLPKVYHSSDYDQDTIRKLGYLVLEKHKDVQGVLLSPVLHRKFHSIYGNKNFTKEDFEQFTSEYLFGIVSTGRAKISEGIKQPVFTDQEYTRLAQEGITDQELQQLYHDSNNRVTKILILELIQVRAASTL